MGGAVGLVGGGYLKVAPQNPVWPAAQPILVSRDGTFEGDSEYVIAGMPGSDAFTGYCVAINRGLGIAMPQGKPPEASSPPTHPLGCYKIHAPWGMITDSDYVVYARI